MQIGSPYAMITTRSQQSCPDGIELGFDNGQTPDESFQISCDPGILATTTEEPQGQPEITVDDSYLANTWVPAVPGSTVSATKRPEIKRKTATSIAPTEAAVIGNDANNHHGQSFALLAGVFLTVTMSS